jgi:PKHD-type hydroxylase|tara:strand:+ start:33814 stop:34425 length:612 start_codon:yes stop_codon:yes gene_type:complete
METCFINSTELGAQRSFCTYYGGSDVFTDKEIEKIKSTGNSLTNEKAKTFGQGESDKSRQGSVSWLPRSAQKNEWVYKALLSLAHKANRELWKFDLIGFWEDAQYTTYTCAPKGENGDFYDYHLDIDGSYGVQRKISVVIQLSDPEDYEGGELELKTSSSSYVAEKKKGTVLLFPSFCLHKVHPVTKGLRNSLVLWVSGMPFK